MIISARYTTADHVQINAVFDGGRDVSMPSYPSHTHFDRDIKAFIDGGGTIADYEKPLSEAQAEKRAEISEAYATAEAANISLGGHDWDADIEALTEALTEAMSVVVNVQGGYTLPANFSWIDTEGVEVPTDANGIKALFKKISIKHYKDAHRFARLKKKINRAATVAEVEAVEDW